MEVGWKIPLIHGIQIVEVESLVDRLVVMVDDVLGRILGGWFYSVDRWQEGGTAVCRGVKADDRQQADSRLPGGFVGGISGIWIDANVLPTVFTSVCTIYTICVLTACLQRLCWDELGSRPAVTLMEEVR